MQLNRLPVVALQTRKEQMNMNYFSRIARLSAVISISLSVVAVFAMVVGVVAVGALGAFLLLYPLILMTAPAVKRMARALEAKIDSKVEAFVKAQEKRKA